MMPVKDIFGQQREGMRALATNGVIGLHFVSGPLVGAAIGFGLDWWLNAGNWLILTFLFIGIGAGFLNVWRDTRALLGKMEKEKSARAVSPPAGKVSGEKNA